MAKIKHANVGTGVETLGEWMGEDLHTVDTEDGILLVSVPPSGYHKIYNLYAEKTGEKYHLKMDYEEIPES